VGDDLPENWPSHGKVDFDEVVFRYRPELPDILHNVSFQIVPSEHFGICGRTGSGKSSLMVILFRLGELKSGRISIDNVDIATIRLQDLRQRISIIPQIPWLFKGTMRENLDPSAIRSDADIWAALSHAHLDAYVRSLPEKLDAPVVERGANLSQGQRQLMCIARALVRKSRVVMMDEATANIDSGTDELIQATVRENFADCTTLTIAHRLTTISDSDRILVLSHGRVVECGRPVDLLKNKGSEVGFAALCRELAADSLDEIERVAAASAADQSRFQFQTVRSSA